MAAVEHSPIDQETGLPMFVFGESENTDIVNYHHHWFPKKSPLLEHKFPFITELFTEELTLHELGGIAVRMSRGQVMPVDVHVRFHQRYIGPQLPRTLHEKFQVAVKGCSGVVPRTAMKIISPYETQFVHLDADEYEALSMNRTVRPEHHYYQHHIEKRRALIGDFFVRYALLQDLSGASEKVVDQFLHTNDSQKRLQLGNLLLKGALDASVAPVRPFHAELRRQGRVLAHVPDVLTTVKKQLVPSQIPRYVDYLSVRLQVA